jgi:hypothetical protein
VRIFVGGLLIGLGGVMFGGSLYLGSLGEVYFIEWELLVSGG